MSTIEDRARFDIIRYANCWEDADILCEALVPEPGKRILSIASGGDNAFALLAEGAEVVAADLSPAQLACVSLKVQAMRALSRSDCLAFIGIDASGVRHETYATLKGDLPEEARNYWDAHTDDIVRGIIHAGKFERFFHTFRKRILPLVHGRRRVNALMMERQPKARDAFFTQQWDTWRWRLLFRVFMSRFVMGRLGRDPEFFRYVEGSVSAHILARAGLALSTLPLHENPYLDYILNGNYTHALPRYLREEHWDDVREGLERLTLFRGTVEDAGRVHGGEGFDGFNLSDIFEYLDPETCEQLYGHLLTVARAGARLAYWNMLVPRSCPDAYAAQVRPLEDLSKSLFERDAAFFYTGFVVEEVQ